MRVSRPFIKLPLSFCADTLAAQVTGLPSAAWSPHPSGFPGNDAVRLITPEGADTDDLVGAMAPTPHLRACPYILEIMSEIGATWGRSRLMGLGPGATVPPHVDIHYYWRTHVRIHVPVITNPGVQFTCDGETIHMKAGECWVLDTFRSHTVVNEGQERRVHLVLDTVGGERLWQLLKAGEAGEVADSILLPGSRSIGELVYEQGNAPKVMTPWEIRCHVGELLSLTVPDGSLPGVSDRLYRFIAGWTAAWAQYEASDAGLPAYSELIATTRDDLRILGGEQLVLRNGRALYFVLDAMLFANAIARPPSTAKGTARPTLAPAGVRRLAS